MFDTDLLSSPLALFDRVNDIDRLRAHIEGMKREGETFTDAVDRFADQVYRSSSTVWRWLSGENKIPRKVLRKLS